MEFITVIADIKAKQGEEEYIKEQLCKLVCPTLVERGVLEYQFYQDKNDPTFFHSYEKWLNESSIKKHLESSHIKRYMDNTEGKVDVFNIKYFNRICNK